MKYVRKEHIDYLIIALCKDCVRITVNWTGESYADIGLKWNCQQTWLDASMNRYVNKLGQCFSHKMPHTQQHIPYRVPKKVCGPTAQDTIPPDETAKMDDDKIKLIQQVGGVCLY